MLSTYAQGTDGLYWPSVFYVILLAALFVSAIILLLRYRSRRLLVKRVAELEALSMAGRAIVESKLDVSASCQLIAKEAGNIIDTRTFQVGLFDGESYEIQYWTVDGQSQPTPSTFDLTSGEGIVNWVRESGRSLLVRDFSKESSSLPARPQYVSDYPPRSGLFIPLISGDEVLGCIAAQSPTPNNYSKEDQDRLTILANQAAAAIANARMYSLERTRAAQLELVGQIAREINAINDLDELLERVVSLTQDTFGYNSVNVFGIDPDEGVAHIQSSSIQGLEPGSLAIIYGEGIVGTSAQRRETILSNNTETDDRFLDDVHSEKTRSEIAIPLVVDEELLGVLDVQSQQTGAFSNQDRFVLEALAAQVAIAIYKARQFARQKEQAWVMTAQLQVAEAISRSPDLESLTKSVVRLYTMLVGVEQCAILLWDEELNAYLGAAMYDSSEGESESFGTVSLKIGDWTALDAVHIGMEELETYIAPPWRVKSKKIQQAEGAQPRSTIYPMVAKGRALGALVTTNYSGSAGDLSLGRQELKRNIAHQSAMAIDSIQVYLAQQEEAWVNTALLQVAEAVNKLTDLNEILNTIVRLLPMLVGVKSSVVLIWEEEEQAYRTGPSHGLTEMGQGLLESFEVDLSEFPLVEKRDVIRAGPDSSSYRFRLPPWMDMILGSETADIFPLYARGRLVGALVVGPTSDHRPLSGRRLNIVTGIAQQAAIAVVNDQLYQESAERSRMEQELNVARSIQASLIPDDDPVVPGCTVSGFWEAAREVSGDFYDYYQLSDQRWGIAIADVADKGVPAALFMALSRTILRTVAYNRKEPAETLMRANQIIYADTTSDLFVTVFYAVWNAAEKTLIYASGGHNPPVLIRSDGSTVLLRGEGVALGILEDVEIVEEQIQLRPGDVVVFYTDGVTEAMNEDYDEFGLERLCLAVKSVRAGSVATIIKTIREAIADHTGPTPQYDDITLVVMKRA